MNRALLIATLFCTTPATARDRSEEDGLPAPFPQSGCLTVGAQRLARAADAYRARYRGGSSRREEVAGLSLEDDEKAIGYLKTSLGRKPPETWQRAVEIGCKTVICALQKTLGDLESALWFLVAAAEIDAPASLDQTPYDVESVWQSHELRALARALLLAPPELKKVSNLKVIRRLPSGQKLRKGGWYNAVSYVKDKDYGNVGTIVIKDTVWKFAQRDMLSVVVHELGHEWEFSRYADKGDRVNSLSDEWLDLSQWKSKSGGKGERDFKLTPGARIATAGEAMPTEDFADTISNFRFLPRLLLSYSKEKFEYMQKLFYRGKDYTRPAPNRELDALWARAGGPLQSVRACAKYIQRASFGPKHHQHELYVVTPTATGTHWEPIPRSSFVVRSKCLERTLAALQRSEGYEELLCRQDPEEIAVAVADRLEDAFAAFGEAADSIRAAVPPSAAEECVEKSDLRQECFNGPTGWNVAQREAGRILEEFGGSRSEAVELANLLLAQTPLAPPTGDLKAKFPIFKSSPEIVFACIKGAIEISPKDPPRRWLYWVKLPPSNERRGFKDPLWNAACQRDFAAHVEKSGVKVSAGDKLFEHLAYVLKNQSTGLVGKFSSQVLGKAKDLRARCGIGGNGSIGRAKAGCASDWLRPRVSSLAPKSLSDELTEHLVAVLRAR